MHIKVIKLAFSLLVTLCLSFILFNTIQNGHLHKIENGAIFFHAHPFDSSQREPLKHHHHTRFELVFFGLITHLFEQSIIAVFLWIIFFTQISHRCVNQVIVSPKTWILTPRLRAPPIKFTGYMACFRIFQLQTY